MNSNLVMQKLVLIAPLVARTVLYVLMGLSVLSIGVIIERWWFFRRRRDNLAALSDDVRRALARGDLTEVKKILAASPSIEAEIVGEAVGWYGDGVDAVEQILAKATRMRRKRFEAGLLVLGTLGNNAPFIGLFGTVLGIVTAFRELGGNQMGAAMGNVMSGIAEALLATAVGILVALPAVIYYNVFQKKGADIEEQAAALGNVVIASMRAGGKPNGALGGKKISPPLEAPSTTVVEMEA
jgi:biopolymer transport protein ExbB/biopolymer transport protein TolQ